MRWTRVFSRRALLTGCFGTAAALLGLCASVLFGMPRGRDMHDSSAIRAFTVMLVPPEGTVPVEGGELPTTRLDTSEIQRNPLPGTAEILVQGERIFQSYCTPCHGSNAKGQGPVGRKLMVPAADLTSERVQAFSDGYLFGTIRYGGTVMPPFASSLSAYESWCIVYYLRSLRTG